MITRSDRVPTRDDRLRDYQARLKWHGVNELLLRAKRRYGTRLQAQLWSDPK